MCGIVAAVAQRDCAEILIEGLRRLEYRGYDSAGITVVERAGEMCRHRQVGKVEMLASALAAAPLHGGTGIAHTRWATHGEPSEANAHPHHSSHIAVVHNGIIENHEQLREELQAKGYHFVSQTDTEVIAHLIADLHPQSDSLTQAVQQAVARLQGAYGMVVLDAKNPDEIVVARSGSPIVIGLGLGENFVASDQLALLPVTRRFIYLEEGDIATINRRDITIYDQQGAVITRDEVEASGQTDSADKGGFRHYMEKEIHEQPEAVANTLAGRLDANHIGLDTLSPDAKKALLAAEHIQIIACGTSYNAGLVARYWFESIAGVSCDVEIASEFRYRDFVVRPNSLLITLSQSGETADTLAALRLAKAKGYMAALSICNVPGSSLVRESDMHLMTRAGAEIGVASTKAFTTQLALLLLLVTLVARDKARLSPAQEQQLVEQLHRLPELLKQVLAIAPQITALAPDFADKHHALFLGRGEFYPIAVEAALKLKEISYIHAEAYAAGELKHGPLALVDSDMPVIVIAPNNELLEKLKSNIEEVRARGGQLYVFANESAGFVSDEGMTVVTLPDCDAMLAPLVYTLPMQLLAYDVALIKEPMWISQET